MMIEADYKTVEIIFDFGNLITGLFTIKFDGFKMFDCIIAGIAKDTGGVQL